MRGRIVLFLVLAVVVALLGVYLGRSTTTPMAVGEPATTTQADSSVGPTQRRDSSSGPSRSPTASSPKAGSPNNHANRDRNQTQPRQKPPPPPASQPPPNTGPVRFGKVTTTPSADGLSVAPSDHRALAATFSDRVVHVLPGATKPATRSFAVTLPLTGGAKGEKLRVYVQGYAYTQGGANAALTLKLNGYETVRGFPSGFDDSYIAVLVAPATPGITYQLSGVLEAHPAPAADAQADLNVNAVDVSIS
jgi:hypothetical protein